MYLMRIFLIEPKKSKNTIHHIHHLDFWSFLHTIKEEEIVWGLCKG
jgi:hypothetical protein